MLGSVVASRFGLTLAMGALLLPSWGTADGATSGVVKPRVLIELFGSEGCSSCPPADEFFAELAQNELAREGIIGLIAWHVDYWDDLGWKDPYGLSAASARQRGYAERMARRGTRKGGVYTPQMIVAGTEPLVGSDRPSARQAMASAFERAGAAAPVDLDVTIGPRVAGDTVRIAATVFNGPARAECVAVVLENDLASDVKRGENAHRLLRHTRVVRATASAALRDGRAAIDLVLPPGLREDHARVLVFVQENDLGPIVGAEELPLNGVIHDTSH